MNEKVAGSIPAGGPSETAQKPARQTALLDRMDKGASL
jgi:hypothetical protein